MSKVEMAGGSDTPQLTWLRQRSDRGPRARRALFLDRDGVVIEDVGYIRRSEDVRLLPGAGVLIRDCNRRNIPVVMVTNQSGVARGYFGWPEFEDVQAEVERQLGRLGASLDIVLACGALSAGAEQHPWRKPNPGMMREAAALLNLDLAGSVMVGDKVSDLQAAARAGIRNSILIETGKGEGETARLPSADLAGSTVEVCASLREAGVRTRIIALLGGR